MQRVPRLPDQTGNSITKPTSGIAWYSGPAAFLSSGVAFLVAVAFLFAAEGPGSADILTTLDSERGRQLFEGTVAAGIVAVVLYVVAASWLFLRLRAVNELGMLIVLALSIVVAPVTIAFLAFQYVPVALAQEHQSTADPAFRQLVVSAHAFADVGGWAVIALLAVSVLIVSAVLWQTHRWRPLAAGGFALFALALLLFVLDSSYLFLLPFGLWEITIAAHLISARSWRDT